jgi:uncharacterized protein
MQQSGTPAELLDALRESNARNWALFCHLSAFLSFVVPFGHIIGPVAVWLTKRAESPFIDWHGREAVNFQITSTIVSFVIMLALVLLLFTAGFFSGVSTSPPSMMSSLIPMLLVLGLFLAWTVTAVVFTLVAGVRASHGRRWQYPVCIRFIR